MIHSEYNSIVDFLNKNQQPSLTSDVNKYFTKVITLSAASYFEHEIQKILIDFISNETKGNSMALCFFKKKAIGMQYHTYFVWGEKNEPSKPGKNANSFFSLFGEDFKKTIEEEIKENPDISEAIKSFLEIGHLRNILVHSNFAAYNLTNKTADDIFSAFRRGLSFVTYVRNKLVPSEH